MRRISFLCFFCLALLRSFAQPDSDNRYAKPLKEVLQDIEKRFGVRISYADTLVAGKVVNYAEWRYRNDVEETLDNVLKPLDMKVRKEKEKVYKVSNYEYYRWPVAEGWAEMDRIAALYADKEMWEQRKSAIIPCLLDALELGRLPPSPGTKPVITNRRKFDGYTIENLAIELLPGLWVNGSLYKPAVYKGKIPVILNPDGHWPDQRYRPDCQYRCAALARMGSMAFSYDLFAWGESLLQFELPDHRRSLSMTIQVLGSIRILDYLLGLTDADTSRVGMTGGSGAGSHTVLMTAIDPRIKVSAPVVSLSSYFYGGCPCESGRNIHSCGGRTNNVELAAFAAPRPQLIVSDGGDWTDRMPEHDFPYLKKMYSWYRNDSAVHNVHLPDEKHDFGINKRIAVYEFMAKWLRLDIKKIKDKTGNYSESMITIEPPSAMYVFGERGEQLPAHAIHGFSELLEVWKNRF